MIKLTTFEHQLRTVLVQRAQVADPVDPPSACITYADLGLAVDPQGLVRYPMTRPPFRGLGEALGHVSMYEAEHGRSLLSALVVEQESRRPGSGFARLGRHLGREVVDEKEFWRGELNEVVAFWSAGDQVLLADASVDRAVMEIRAMKSLLRRVLGGDPRASQTVGQRLQKHLLNDMLMDSHTLSEDSHNRSFLWTATGCTYVMSREQAESLIAHFFSPGEGWRNQLPEAERHRKPTGADIRMYLDGQGWERHEGHVQPGSLPGVGDGPARSSSRTAESTR